MKQQRDYEWFKKMLTRGQNYNALVRFNEECPALYSSYRERFEKEQNPDNEIKEMLSKM